ncbi:MAG: OmpH family outer membrane protein [Bacteroidales bacterium]|nr:OmpH family outer membrane protein [Bacteroidales bacterium]
MKKLLSVICMMTLLVTIATAQQKFGHVNFSEVYEMIPGQDTARAAYETYVKNVQSQLETMATEFDSKYRDYQANLATMSKLIKDAKEKELQDLQTRIQAFQEAAQADMQNKELELTQPLIDRGKKIIEEIAKENGYTYIFNSSEGLLLYATPSDDIMPLIKKKLGL